MPKRKASTSTPVNDENDSQVEKQTTAIVPNGDLYMVFNSNDSESKRLLVSRYILCLSSKVFDAMVGDSSQFQEATNPTLSHDGIREVAFNDDDFPAMLMIMNILHLQHDRVLPRISFTQLRETAMICDKYDLVQSVDLWPATWAQHYVDRIEKKAFEDWLLIASVFRQKEAFTKITRHLIVNSKIDANTGELVTADGFSFTEGVPSTVVEKMNAVRAATMIALQECIWNRFRELQSTETERRLCRLSDECGYARNDLEREHCDTWNLGCLARYFPNMTKPWDEDEHHGSTIMAIIKKIDIMDTFQNENAGVLSESFIISHIRVTSCGYVSKMIRIIVHRVKGLKLDIQ